eukprot:11228363-Lingulodinium_polyedra.AAC.1
MCVYVAGQLHVLARAAKPERVCCVVALVRVIWACISAIYSHTPTCILKVSVHVRVAALRARIFFAWGRRASARVARAYGPRAAPLRPVGAACVAACVRNQGDGIALPHRAAPALVVFFRAVFAGVRVEKAGSGPSVLDAPVQIVKRRPRALLA